VNPPLTAPCARPRRARVPVRPVLLVVLALLVLAPMGVAADGCEGEACSEVELTATTEDACPPADETEDLADPDGPAIPELPAAGEAADGAGEEGDDPAPCEPTEQGVEAEPAVPVVPDADVPSPELPATSAPLPSGDGGPVIPALPGLPGGTVSDDAAAAVGPRPPVRAQGQGTPTEIAPPPAPESAPETAQPVETSPERPPVAGHSSGPRLSSTTAEVGDAADRIEIAEAPQVAVSDARDDAEELEVALGSTDAPMVAPSAPAPSPALGTLPITYGGGNETSVVQGVLWLVVTIVVLLGMGWFGSYAAALAQPSGQGLAPRRRDQRLAGQAHGVAPQRGQPSV
jgi:hypothetical protein